MKWHCCMASVIYKCNITSRFPSPVLKYGGSECFIYVASEPFFPNYLLDVYIPFFFFFHGSFIFFSLYIFLLC